MSQTKKRELAVREAAKDNKQKRPANVWSKRTKRGLPVTGDECALCDTSTAAETRRSREKAGEGTPVWVDGDTGTVAESVPTEPSEGTDPSAVGGGGVPVGKKATPGGGGAIAPVLTSWARTDVMYC